MSCVSSSRAGRTADRKKPAAPGVPRTDHGDPNSAATNQWGYGLDEPKLSQATYNVLSDMGVQRGTPTGIIADAGNQAPRAVATASPTSGRLPLAVNFNGTGSSDQDGTIS